MSVSDALLTGMLTEADSLLFGLLENELVGVYVIQGGRFAYVNATLAKMFGYAQEEICGRLGPMELTCPEDQDRARAEIAKRVEGQAKASFYSFQGLRKDGSSFRNNFV